MQLGKRETLLIQYINDGTVIRVIRFSEHIHRLHKRSIVINIQIS